MRVLGGCMQKKNDIVVIAGMSCAGKSTLLKAIRRGDCPEINDRLGIGKLDQWQLIPSRRLAGPDSIKHPHVLIHFDLYRQCKEETNFAQLARCLESQEDIRVVTLCAPPEVLARRSMRKIGRALLKVCISSLNPLSYTRRKYTRHWVRHRRKLRELSRFWEKYLLLGNVRWVDSAYQSWFDFVESQAVGDHWLLRTYGNPKENALVDYDAKRARAFLATDTA